MLVYKKKRYKRISYGDMTRLVDGGHIEVKVMDLVATIGRST